jgi:hypothetical protein
VCVRTYSWRSDTIQTNKIRVRARTRARARPLATYVNVQWVKLGALSYVESRIQMHYTEKHPERPSTEKLFSRYYQHKSNNDLNKQFYTVEEASLSCGGGGLLVKLFGDRQTTLKQKKHKTRAYGRVDLVVRFRTVPETKAPKGSRGMLGDSEYGTLWYVKSKCRESRVLNMRYAIVGV